MKKLILILFLLVTSCGFNTIQKRQAVFISKAAYATNDSLTVGRFDLATEHSNRLITFIAPPSPSDRITIKPFINSHVDKKANSNIIYNTNPIVVLPLAFKTNPIIFKNSPEFFKMLMDNKELERQIEEEQKLNVDLNKDRDRLKREKENDYNKLQESQKRSNRFLGILKIFTGIFGILGIAAVALMVFVPGVIPLVLNVFSTIFGIIRNLLVSIVNWINTFFKK